MMSLKDNQKFYWLKTDKDHYNSYKIKALLAEKKGDTYTVIYEQLSLESLNYGGILRYSEKRAYTTDELAYVINRPVRLLEETLAVLERKELIEIGDDGTIYIPDVKERVGYTSGQTLRKSKVKDTEEYGNSVVNFTNDLPNNSVKPTLEIRDKSIENREEEDVRRRFRPPTVEEVAEYCQKRNNGIDPERFVDFYQSKNWMVGRSKMKDWQACVRTWEKNHPKKTENMPVYDTSKNVTMSAEMQQELERMLNEQS